METFLYNKTPNPNNRFIYLILSNMSCKSEKEILRLVNEDTNHISFSI